MKSRYILLVLLVFAVGFATGRGLSAGREKRSTESDGSAKDMVLVPVSSLAPVPGGLSPEEKRDIEVFRRAQPSVVFITSLALRRELFSFDIQQIPQGTGSGFVWDREGHIVTNFHVI